MFGFHDRRERPASGVAGHLQNGESHVAADAERDAEPDATEKRQLEPSGTSRARVAAVRTAVVAHLVERSLASASAHLVGYLVQLSVVVRDIGFRAWPTNTAQTYRDTVHPSNLNAKLLTPQLRRLWIYPLELSAPISSRSALVFCNRENSAVNWKNHLCFVRPTGMHYRDCSAMKYAGYKCLN